MTTAITILLFFVAAGGVWLIAYLMGNGHGWD